MRLIDADAYKKYLDEKWIVANYDAIDAQPTIDAEPVIHCKDCKYFYETFPWDMCMEETIARVTEGNAFCSRAERRDDDT